MPTHAEQRVLPYSPKQMFDLVAEIDRYDEFLPWCVGARIKERKENIVLADLVIGFWMFRERFGSRVTFLPARCRIETEYIDGPFKHMRSNWEFEDVERGCEVRFDVDFEFKSRLLQGAAGLFFQDAMTRIVRAFEARARELYGDA